MLYDHSHMPLHHQIIKSKSKVKYKKKYIKLRKINKSKEKY